MDSLLKQRLVGAIVLVALGVIFIPMLLEGPNRTLVPKMDEMPVPETLAPELPLERFPPVSEPRRAERAIMTDATGSKIAEEDRTPEALQPAKTEAVPKPAAVVPPKPVIAPVKSPAAEAPTTKAMKDSWIVQVVSLSSKGNALALRDKLRKGGFATQVEQVRVGGKTHYRVRVGPFLERVEADRVRKQIADRFAQNGRVMSWP
ncbi:hypothetical protein MNBD_GAMMA14-1754 [hydrothermal vent metagenome]|uniref:SPOR domain-containing protein n=1 Tax=hydrothermal vent metagenome TaxID=652676 RepID=A0A3B0YQM4_9ZZZZ